MSAGLKIAVFVFLCSVAGMIAWTDYRKMIIPDWINLLTASSGIFVSVVLLRAPLLQVALGSLVVLFLGWLIARVYKGLRGHHALGMGDIKFLGAAAAWTGLVGMPWLLMIASFGGLTHIFVKGLLGHTTDRMTRIPFGPYLASGLILVWSLDLGGRLW